MLDVVLELVAEMLDEAFTGSAAVSPSAQIVRPAMLSETDSNTSRPRSCPSPCSMGGTIRHSQPVPSRTACTGRRTFEVEVRSRSSERTMQRVSSMMTAPEPSIGSSLAIEP